MIIYSVTVSVDRAASAEWLEWMTSVHIPDVMATGYFGSHAVRRVLEPVEREGMDTYTIEYTCDSRERYEAYRRDAAPALQRDHQEKFAGRFVASRRVFEAAGATSPGPGRSEMFLGGGDFDPHDAEVVSAIDDLSLWSAPFGLKLLEVVRLGKNLRALDVGSGLGFPAVELSQRLGETCRVWGIDPWTEAVERARLKIRTWGIGNLEIVEGKAEAMPFDDEFFDLVVSNNGTNNVGDEATEVRVYNEIARVARPGAQVVFTVNLPGTMAEFYAVFRRVLARRGLAEARARLEEHIFAKRKPLAHIRKTVRAAGLVVDGVHEDSFALRFTDGTTMLRHFLIRLAFLGSWRDVVGEGDAAAVFEEIEKALNGVAAKAGELRLSVPWVCVDCHKPPKTA